MSHETWLTVTVIHPKELGKAEERGLSRAALVVVVVVSSKIKAPQTLPPGLRGQLQLLPVCRRGLLGER